MVCSTILVSAFGAGSYCRHCMRVYRRPFSFDPPFKMKYRLFQCIQTKTPNICFFLSTGVFNFPLVSSWFWNYMLDRYTIRNFCVGVFITPMKRSPCFHDSSTAITDVKYESVQTILSVLSHGSTGYFSMFLLWGIFYSSSFCSSSLLADLIILIRIIIPKCPHAALCISSPFSVFLSIATYISKHKLIQWTPCLYHCNIDSSAHMISEIEKSCVRYSLKLVTNSSTSFYQWASWIVTSSCRSGWWIYITCLHIILKWCLFMPVLKKIRSRSLLWLRDSRPQAGPVSKF